MQVVAGFLVSAGCAFVLVGIAKVIADIVLAFRGAPKIETRGLADEITAITGLVNAVAALPSFVLTSLIGVLLIAAGQRLAAGLQIIPF